MDQRIHTEKTTLDGILHRIDKDKIDEFIEFVLCYPRTECKELKYRLNFLIKNHYQYLIEYGKRILNYRILGKGYSSIIVLGYHKYYGLGVLKVRRIDSRRKSLEHEGIILDYLDKTLITPNIYQWSKDFIFMEYIDPYKCLSIEHYITSLIEKKNNYSIKTAKHVLRRILIRLYLIDKLGIDHGELNRPYEHLYVCRDNTTDTMYVKIIDWESSRFSLSPKNVTSFTSFILYRYPLRNVLFENINEEFLEKTRRVLRAYRKTYSIQKLIRLIKLLGLP